MQTDSQTSRVFIGIKMNWQIAESLVELQDGLGRNIPARFVSYGDFHLTLVPPWEMPEEEYKDTVDKIKEVLKNAKRFTLKLNRLVYGPDKNYPRLLWIECGAAPELAELRKNLLKTFNVRDSGAFIPHVTVIRFREEHQKLMKQLLLERDVNLSMAVESVEFFKSPRISGTGYTVLESLLIR